MKKLIGTVLAALLATNVAHANSADINQQLCQSIGDLAYQVVVQRDHGTTYKTASRNLERASQDQPSQDARLFVRMIGKRILTTAYKAVPNIKPEQAARMYFLTCMTNLN